MIAAHGDNPGRPIDWVQISSTGQATQGEAFPGTRRFHMRPAFGAEANAFLDRRSLRLSGETQDRFIEEFVRAKEQAA